MPPAVPVGNPATGEIIGHRPVSSPEEVDAAVEAARAAQAAWAARPEAERVALIEEAMGHVEAAADDVAEGITREQGKPLSEAVGEARLSSFLAHTLCHLPFGREVVFEDDARRVEAHYTPYGVVGVVGPWNFPLAVPLISIVPALRLGNTVVFKPSEYTTLVALQWADLLNRTLPPGVLNVACGAGDVGARVVEHPHVDKVVFTGSGVTGRKVAAACGARLKPVTLELGGNDAAIVLPEARVEDVAPAVFDKAFMNCGQMCIAIKRLYVHRPQYGEMVDALAELAEKRRVGNGLDDGVEMGPLQNEMQLGVVEELVADAKARGARIAAGGQRGDPHGFFFQPTIVADIAEDARLVREEQFGPALPVLPYDSVDEAVEKANSTDVGLGASVWGHNQKLCDAVAARLEAGSVWINAHAMLDPRIPFGGIKESGIGTEMGVAGLRNLCKRAIVTVMKNES